jgi:hypothetical protein
MVQDPYIEGSFTRTTTIQIREKNVAIDKYAIPNFHIFNTSTIPSRVDWSPGEVASKEEEDLHS